MTTKKSRKEDYPLCLIVNDRDWNIEITKCNNTKETQKWVLQYDMIVSMSPSLHFCEVKYSRNYIIYVCSNEFERPMPDSSGNNFDFDDGRFNFWIRVSSMGA